MVTLKTDKEKTALLTVLSGFFYFIFLFLFQGGIVLFQLVDTYGPSGTSLLFIACAETIVIGWVYGKLLALN